MKWSWKDNTKFLLADDCEMSSQFLMNILKSAGYENIILISNAYDVIISQCRQMNWKIYYLSYKKVKANVFRYVLCLERSERNVYKNEDEKKYNSEIFILLSVIWICNGGYFPIVCKIICK